MDKNTLDSKMSERAKEIGWILISFISVITAPIWIIVYIIWGFNFPKYAMDNAFNKK